MTISSIASVLSLTAVITGQGVPDTQTLLRVAQQAKSAYCLRIPDYGPQLLGRQIEISHYERMSRDVRWQPDVQAGLITIKRKRGSEETALGDYQEIITPSKKMLEITKDVQPNGSVICTGDRKITGLTDIHAFRDNMFMATATFSFKPRAWNTPAIAKFFNLPYPPKTSTIAFVRMPDGTWKIQGM